MEVAGIFVALASEGLIVFPLSFLCERIQYNRQMGKHFNAMVYPRVCGVDSHPPSPLPPMHGLSPRVRGRSRLAGPLCAGSVYPRMCGVDLTLIVVIGILSGLSPRVRGR